MSTTAYPAVTASGQPVLILKEGSSQTKGRDAQRNNIVAAKLVAGIVRSSLGPRGMDKMLVDSMGDVTITNDGATILKELDIQHPAAKMLVEIAKATDSEVGDGTTSAVVFAGALIEKAEELLDKDVHPTIVVDGYKKAATQAQKILEKISIKVPPSDREWLLRIAKTSMVTKLVSREAVALAEHVVDALLHVAEKSGTVYKVDIDDVKVEKKSGGSIKDTSLIRGIVLDKEVVHAGMPKKVVNAKIALINAPLEIEKTEFDAKINISNPEQIKAFLDEENKMLKDMADKIVKVGASVVICQKGVDDIAQHYMAKAGVLAVRRVKESDLTKLAKATGGRVVTNLDDLGPKDLGSAATVEERKIEEDKWVFIEGCKNPKAVTILARGGTQRIVDEAERALHDALMVVKDVLQKPAIVVGGGAPEAELAHQLREYSTTLGGREQLAVQKFAEALEAITIALAENAGLDPIDTQVELRAAHSQGKKWYGVGALSGKVEDMEAVGVYEPSVVKEQIISSATEAASMILRIDDVIASSKMKQPMPGGHGEGGMGPMGGMGED
ncbi:MAG: TCP-1/cpn60 chaperonin family protein [Thaumarchaeota archaeon]|nr:TCP-1/cpn60 chaperonin family protein [Nitrososphaerota archaeon]